VGKAFMIDSNKRTLSSPDTDKVDLIYSINTITPLFVRKASYELEKKNIDEAINILTKGLKHYPNFAAAYLLLGKLFALKGQYTEAIENIKKGSDLIPSKKTYDFYLNEIENIKNKISISSTNIVRKTETELKETKKEDDIEPLPKDEKLEELVKEVAPDKKPSSKISDSKSSGKNIIASETLAKIYASQGEYKEAIDIYNLLKEKHPDKVDFYSNKVKELEEKLSS
jgi:tetratricopeptide (TPR) repeat protein